MPLSIVIPALDAAVTLGATLDALVDLRADRQRAEPPCEVLVVDGGSGDGTAALAEARGARVLHQAGGRGRQLAAGATAATGDWLLFLHADTCLQPGWAGAVVGFLRDPTNADRAAAFRLALDDTAAQARRIEALANWRARRLGLPYGDQGLLISRRLYDAIGGFRPLPLMEDVDLARRLGRRRISLLPAAAVTSAERYRRDGWWARPLRNLSLLCCYFLGAPPGLLKRLYG